MSALMLFEDVPLKSTAIFGDFFSPEPIGHHYGDLSASRVRCTQVESMLYLVAEHPWQAVTSCYVSDHKTADFMPLVRTDHDGVTRQYIQLSAPPAYDNAVVAVAGKGKMSPISGRLLENPDEIIEDIAKLCNKVVRFPLFREACNKRDLRIAGSVAQSKSLRSYINEIVQSCGALWLQDTVHFIGDPIGYATPVHYPDDVSMTVSIDDVVGSLSVWYAWNHALDHHSGYMALKAVGCQYTNPGVYYAKWLRQPKDAEEVARRLLGIRAGAALNVQAKVPGAVHVGEKLEFTDQVFNGKMVVTKSVPDEAESSISGQLILSVYPYLVITQVSMEDASVRSERVDVLLDIVKREAIITIFDSQNRPMPNVFVTYDSMVTKKTNTLGTVKLPVTTGTHTIALSGGGIDNSDPYPLIVP